MRSWLNKPYPFLFEDVTARFKIALFVFIFVFLFLLVFQPFNLRTEIGVNIYWACCIYALTSAITAFLFVSMMIKVFPKYANERSWTIGKEFSMMFSILLIISLANFILGMLIELHPTTGQNISLWQLLTDDIFHTFAIGIFPIMVITFTNYTILLKRNLSRVAVHNASIGDREAEVIINAPLVVEISSDTKNNNISLDLEQVVFIMADGNYIEFHLQDGAETKREIRRNTMNNIANQLSGYHFLFRSHRAYLINLNQIVESKGNAQGYQLKLKHSDQNIPVSRANLSNFDGLMSSFSNES